MTEEKLNDGIVKKIRKLLSLSMSDNKSEADAAYKKAMHLMLKHNIEMLDKPKDYFVERTHVKRSTLELKYVCQILLSCFFVRITKGRVFDKSADRMITTYHFYGERANLEIALYALEYLQKEFINSWSTYKKKNRALNKEKASYYFGLCYGFTEAFDERKNFIESEGALIVIDDPALNDFVNELNPKLGSCKEKMNMEYRDALMDGMSDGANLKIAKGVEQKSNSEILFIANG